MYRDETQLVVEQNTKYEILTKCFTRDSPNTKSCSTKHYLAKLQKLFYIPKNNYTSTTPIEMRITTN